MAKRTSRIQCRNAKWLQGLLARSAAVYFTKRLGVRGCSILIEFVSGLRRKEHCRGMAHRNSARGYHIKLERSLKHLAMVRCLAHEMIHVKQWRSGTMEDIDADRGSVRWKKKIYHLPKLSYKLHPWEREAYRYDDALAESFIRACK